MLPWGSIPRAFWNTWKVDKPRKEGLGGGVSSDTSQGALNIINLKRISPCKCQF